MAKTNTPTSSQSSIILDRSIKSLQNSSAAVTKAVGDLNGLVEKAESLAQDIQDKEAQLADLASRNDTAVREADAELRLQVKENRTKVLAELLNEGGLAQISAVELAALRSDLQAAQASNEAAVTAAVKAAVGAVERDAKAAAALKEAEVKVAAAQKDATIAGLTDRVNFLTEQTKQLQGQIDSERQTRLQIAQADAGRQGVVIQQGKQ